ncbi:MAG: hypothetical protein AB8G96_16170 [Phycisphaerales bacterium]
MTWESAVLVMIVGSCGVTSSVEHAASPALHGRVDVAEVVSRPVDADVLSQLWPRPVVTPRAVEEAIALYRPPGAAEIEIRQRVDRYLAEISVLAAEIDSATDLSADRREANELFRQLVSRANEEAMLFPGLETWSTKPETRASESDPRWRSLKRIHDRIAGREAGYSARLQSLGRALLSDIEIIADEHGALFPIEMATRVAYASSVDGIWSVNRGLRPVGPCIIDVVPTIHAVSDDDRLDYWRRVAIAMGGVEILPHLLADSQSAVVGHDAALLEVARAAFLSPPRRTAQSGAGGLPGPIDVQRSEESSARRFRTITRVVIGHVESFALSVRPGSDTARFILHESLWGRMIDQVAGREAVSPWVCVIQGHVESNGELGAAVLASCDELLQAMTVVTVEHYRLLLPASVSRCEQMLIDPSEVSDDFREVDVRIRQLVSQYEASMRPLISELNSQLLEAGLEPLPRFGQDQLERRRPRWISVASGESRTTDGESPGF